MKRDAGTLLATLLGEFAAHAPRAIEIVPKGHIWHQRVIDRVLRALTLGGQSTYLTQYVTTLGHTIYVPETWPDWPAARRWVVLRHEAVHVAQFERLGWLLMTLVYVFLPLPAFLAYGRARLEWEAYRETLRCTAELEGLAAASDPALREHIVRRFTGPDYGWMWPFPSVVRRWVGDELSRIESERHGHG
ncbi:MAG: hypothetical protein WCJ30_11655 [Deltaproteobacteria bacterium]